MDAVTVIWIAIVSGLVLSNYLLWRQLYELKGVLILHFEFHMRDDPGWEGRVGKFLDEAIEEDN